MGTLGRKGLNGLLQELLSWSVFQKSQGSCFLITVRATTDDTAMNPKKIPNGRK